VGAKTSKLRCVRGVERLQPPRRHADAAGGRAGSGRAASRLRLRPTLFVESIATALVQLGHERTGSGPSRQPSCAAIRNLDRIRWAPEPEDRDSHPGIFLERATVARFASRAHPAPVRTRPRLSADPAPRRPHGSIPDTGGHSASTRVSGRVGRSGRCAQAPQRAGADSLPRRSSRTRTCAAGRGSRLARRRHDGPVVRDDELVRDLVADGLARAATPQHVETLLPPAGQAFTNDARRSRATWALFTLRYVGSTVAELVARYPHPGALARRAGDGWVFPALRSLESRGLVWRQRGHYRLTRRGRDELAMGRALARLLVGAT
jgi:hypothetical protein